MTKRFEWPAWLSRLSQWIPLPSYHLDCAAANQQQARQWGVRLTETHLTRWYAAAAWGDFLYNGYSNRLWLAYLSAWWRVIWYRLFSNYTYRQQRAPYWYLVLMGDWSIIAHSLCRKLGVKG